MKNFKLGQRVRIRQWDDMEKEFGLNCLNSINCMYSFTKSMKNICGRIAVITEIYINGKVELDFEDKSGNIDHVYSIDMIEPYFTKADLKYGYLVVLRNGDKAIYMPTSEGNSFDYADEYRCLELKNYKDDLIYDSCLGENEKYDVVKVYGHSYWGHRTCRTDTNYRELLWERKEEPKVKELTAEEAAKLLKEKFSDFDEIKITV